MINEVPSDRINNNIPIIMDVIVIGGDIDSFNYRNKYDSKGESLEAVDAIFVYNGFWFSEHDFAILAIRIRDSEYYYIHHYDIKITAETIVEMQEFFEDVRLYDIYSPNKKVLSKHSVEFMTLVFGLGM